MGKKHSTVLPHLEESLEKLRDEQIRPGGSPDGLGGHNLDTRDPEIADPYRVSNTHPFRDDDEEKDEGKKDEDESS